MPGVELVGVYRGAGVAQSGGQLQGHFLGFAFDLDQIDAAGTDFQLRYAGVDGALGNNLSQNGVYRYFHPARCAYVDIPLFARDFDFGGSAGAVGAVVVAEGPCRLARPILSECLWGGRATECQCNENSV